MKTEYRDVSGFRHVEIRGSGELTVEQNGNFDQPQSLTIEADEELLPDIRSEVKNGRLVLEFRFPWWDITKWMSWFTFPKKVNYRVVMNDIEGFTINGSGKVTSPKIDADACHLTISGSGTMEFEDLECEILHTTISGSGKYVLAGEAKRYEGQVSGSGKILASEFVTGSTQVVISGSGYAEVNAEEELDVRISGSGTVRYRGEPKISQSISGAGSVTAF